MEAGHGLAGHGLAGHGLAGHNLAGHNLAGHSLAGHNLAGHGLAGHSLAGHSLAHAEPCAPSLVSARLCPLAPGVGSVGLGNGHTQEVAGASVLAVPEFILATPSSCTAAEHLPDALAAGPEQSAELPLKCTAWCSEWSTLGACSCLPFDTFLAIAVHRAHCRGTCVPLPWYGGLST